MKKTIASIVFITLLVANMPNISSTTPDCADQTFSDVLACQVACQRVVQQGLALLPNVAKITSFLGNLNKTLDKVPGALQNISGGLSQVLSFSNQTLSKTLEIVSEIKRANGFFDNILQKLNQINIEKYLQGLDFNSITSVQAILKNLSLKLKHDLSLVNGTLKDQLNRLYDLGSISNNTLKLLNESLSSIPKEINKIISSYTINLSQQITSALHNTSTQLVSHLTEQIDITLKNMTGTITDKLDFIYKTLNDKLSLLEGLLPNLKLISILLTIILVGIIVLIVCLISYMGLKCYKELKSMKKEKRDVVTEQHESNCTHDEDFILYALIKVIVSALEDVSKIAEQEINTLFGQI